MVRLLLLLVAAPAALGLENVDFLPHFRHGHHHGNKHEHGAHRGHVHTHELKLKAEASPDVVKVAKPMALEASTPAVTTTAAATAAATTTTPAATTTVVTTPAATSPAAATPAATTTPVALPSLKEEDPVLEVQPVEVQPVDDSASAGTSQLQVDLVEMKQNKVHIVQLEQTLREDASLLRESSTLEHVSHSTRGHASAARQVKQAAQLVKSTEAMLVESRADAVEKSQAMLREAAAAREAADSLSAEAADELKLFTNSQMQAPAHKALREPVATPVTKQAASSDEDIDIEDEN